MRKLFVQIGLGATLCVAIIGTTRLRQAAYVNTFFETQHNESRTMPSIKDIDAFRHKAEAIREATTFPDQARAVDELAPYLSDPDTSIQHRAVRALGLIRTPKSLAVLSGYQTKTGDENSELHRLVGLQIGRVKAAKLTGKDKIATLLAPLHLAFGDVVALSQRVNAPIGRAMRENTSGDQVVKETVDLLLEMKSSGEDVSYWESRLTLNPEEKLIINLGGKTDKQKAQDILNFLWTIRAHTGDVDYLLDRYFVPLGDDGRAAVLAMLKDMVKGNAKYQDSRYGPRYDAVFLAAYKSGESNAQPLVAHFAEDGPSGWVKTNAHGILNLFKAAPKPLLSFP
jgi:hypothetical protein